MSSAATSTRLAGGGGGRGEKQKHKPFVMKCTGQETRASNSTRGERGRVGKYVLELCSVWFTATVVTSVPLQSGGQMPMACHPRTHDSVSHVVSLNRDTNFTCLPQTGRYAGGGVSVSTMGQRREYGEGGRE